MTWSVTQVTRGLQLAWLGSVLAFENRHLYRHTYMKVFLWLCLFSVILYVLSVTVLLLPLKILRFILGIFIRIIGFSNTGLGDNDFSSWVANWVFNLPLFGLLFMRYIYPEPLDSLFLESLRQVDYQYLKKHNDESDLRPAYAPLLEKYDNTINYWDEMKRYIKRTLIQMRNATALYMLSFIPLVGRMVYPAASAWYLINLLGLYPACAVGVLMYITPGTKYLAIVFLETLNVTRTLTREVLEPYFSRIKFGNEEKKEWFKEREGILLGFSIAFYPLIRLPLLGMFFFGIAQAAAALLLVKVTDPPPPPEDLLAYRKNVKYKDPRKSKNKDAKNILSEDGT
ncbi:2837_t:CDS:2 [Paraglomus occultum]|uniref:2837_t:CDS:1 n=1 Tax=Paraglomus occultum TaxID=144539 RepID=A0A9N8W3Y4_9GLOM|nr:2837_t:CDS:2 [Paraglomus occultum]